jgi:hypothetical protein
MTLRERQSIFAINLAKLIVWINEQPDHTCTLGEVYRTDEQQYIYIKLGKSKSKRSKHQDRLAADINIFISGEYQTQSDAYEEAAKYWQSLHPDNQAGYEWSWDANHFQMNDQ